MELALKLVNKLYPEHCRSSCSDENPINAMPLTEEGLDLSHACNRCTALKTLKQLEENA